MFGLVVAGPARVQTASASSTFRFSVVDEATDFPNHFRDARLLVGLKRRGTLQVWSTSWHLNLQAVDRFRHYHGPQAHDSRNNVMSKRSFSFFELMSYVILWAFVIAAFGADLKNPPAAVGLPVLLLPGLLIGGPIGLLIWGRRAFFPAAFVGLLVWLALLIYPALDAVR